MGRNKYCEGICLIECNSIYYTIKPYYALNGRPYAQVDIYYEDLSSTEITEIPKTSSDSLFGSIGGILGQFLGATVLSLADISEFIFFPDSLRICFVTENKAPESR